MIWKLQQNRQQLHQIHQREEFCKIGQTPKNHNFDPRNPSSRHECQKGKQYLALAHEAMLPDIGGTVLWRVRVDRIRPLHARLEDSIYDVGAWGNFSPRKGQHPAPFDNYLQPEPVYYDNASPFSIYRGLLYLPASLSHRDPKRKSLKFFILTPQSF